MVLIKYNNKQMNSNNKFPVVKYDDAREDKIRIFKDNKNKKVVYLTPHPTPLRG